MRHCLTSLFLLVSLAVAGQVTVRITSLPANTPPDPTLYIAGTFNNWNPGDSNYIFTKSGNHYEITLAAGTGEAQYKITRGSWSTCEGTATGGQSTNRVFTYSPGLIVNIQVAGWEGNSGQPSTALPNVKIIRTDFPVPQLGKTRRVWIYLPDQYHTDSTLTYPVIYMHDGQNVFDASTSFSGEWGVDETLVSKQQSTGKSCITVAIDNGDAERLNEYSPFVNPTYGGGKGEHYVEFIRNTLKPYIDSNYRTKPERANTAIAGSSMGGLISLYAMLRFPETFGKAGIFSPSIWFSDSLFAYALEHTRQYDAAFYFVAGTNESQGMVKDIDSMINILKKAGYDQSSITKVIKADGAHSEWFWKREFGPFFDWLYKDVTSGLHEPANKLSPAIYPNPATDSFSLNMQVNNLILTDHSGKPLQKWKGQPAGSVYKLAPIPPGYYLLRGNTGNDLFTGKILIK